MIAVGALRAPGEKVGTGFSQNPARNKESRALVDSY
jgi:hypothetical protein